MPPREQLLMETILSLVVVSGERHIRLLFHGHIEHVSERRIAHHYRLPLQRSRERLLQDRQGRCSGPFPAQLMGAITRNGTQKDHSLRPYTMGDDDERFMAIQGELDRTKHVMRDNIGTVLLCKDNVLTCGIRPNDCPRRETGAS